MKNNELIKHIKKRIEEEESIIVSEFLLDVQKLNNTELHNIITRCNWLISLRT